MQILQIGRGGSHRGTEAQRPALQLRATSLNSVQKRFILAKRLGTRARLCASVSLWLPLLEFESASVCETCGSISSRLPRRSWRQWKRGSHRGTETQKPVRNPTRRFAKTEFRTMSGEIA